MGDATLFIYGIGLGKGPGNILNSLSLLLAYFGTFKFTNSPDAISYNKQE